MMWRWVIGFMLLGLMELLLVIQLHQWFSVKNMLLIYIVTTVVGFLFLFLIKRQVFKGHRISKKAHQRLRQKLSKKTVLLGDEKQQFKIEMMLLYYFIAWVLIVIPGLLTDVMGMLLVLPGLMNWMVDKAIINYDQESVSFSKNKHQSPVLLVTFLPVINRFSTTIFKYKLIKLLPNYAHCIRIFIDWR